MTLTKAISRNMQRRNAKNVFARSIFAGAVIVGIMVLIILIGSILRDGVPWLNWDFLTHFSARSAHDAGIKSALWGTIWLAMLTVLICFPLGIGAAIWLEEYAKESWFIRAIKINIANLAGVPSIIYGLLGLTLFVGWLGLGRSIIAGALTMTLLVLPLVIMTTQEALRSIPRLYRQAAYALGATPWQVVRHIILPSAMPAISTGMIFAIARAIGEAAPIITISALVYLTTVPTSPFSRFTVLPLQIFNWLSRPQEAFHGLAAAGIIVLLLLLLLLNGTAIYFRSIFQKKSEE